MMDYEGNSKGYILSPLSAVLDGWTIEVGLGIKETVQKGWIYDLGQGAEEDRKEYFKLIGNAYH